MLKLKVQYFVHLMLRANSLEKTPMMGKIEGRRRRGQQRIRWFVLGTEAMTNLYSILKNGDITLLTKVCLVKTMVFPVVMYGCRVGL